MKINKQDIIDMLIKYNPNISYTIIKDVVDNYANNVDLDNINPDSILAHKGYQFIVRLLDEELPLVSLCEDVLRRYTLIRDYSRTRVMPCIREYNKYFDIKRYSKTETFKHDGWNKISPIIRDILRDRKFLVHLIPEGDGYNVVVDTYNGYQYTCGNSLEEAKYMALDLLRAHYIEEEVTPECLIYRIGE